MSGDVQPRRRKDKKRKKEEQIEENVVQPQAPPTPTILANDDVNIHLHKESTLGGGICAKCIFFALMIIITVVIGITITEHRGVTDVDIPTSESRFASIFEGWVEKNLDSHDDDDVHIGSEEISHEEEEDEEEEEDAASDEHEASDERSDEEENDDVKAASDEESEAEDSEQVVSEDDDEEEEEEEEEEEVIEEEESVQEDDESQEDDETDQVDEESQEDDDKSASEDAESEEAEKEILAEESEPDEQDVSEEEIDEREGAHSEEAEEDEEDISNKNDETPSQAEEMQDIEEEAQNDDNDDNEEDDNAEINTANMAAKFGVGVSLLIVAYVVLVKKWKSDKASETIGKNEEEQIPDLTRRNTFIPPPTLEEVEQDIENIDEEYSEEDEDGEESEDERRNVPSGKRQYEELRTTYNRSLTPDSDSENNRRRKYGDSEEDEEEEEGDYDREQEEDEDAEEEEEEGDDREDREEEYENDEDEELMKKLEAKYGRLDTKSSKYADEEDEYADDADEEEDTHFPSWKRVKSGAKGGADSDSDNDQNVGVTKKRSGAQSAYDYENITNADDYIIRNDLDKAQRHLVDNVQLALSLFTKILENHPNSPRALYGKAQALDSWAEIKRSNEVLQEAIQAYLGVMNAHSTVPDILFATAGERCINRMRFIGNYGRAINVHKKLIDRFPSEPKYKNELSVTYLTINKIPEARSVLIDILKRWPNDGFALVHYGFILKTVDNELNEAVDYLRRGIETKEQGVIDGRFYFHLGDALARLGKRDEAMKIYENGVANKVFLSKYQRSLYNVDRLTGRPWWNKEQTPYASLYKQLEQNFLEIRNEALAVLNKKGYFKDESENLKDVGDWKQFELYARGVRHTENCNRCPVTCRIVDSEPNVKGCRRGQVKFSVMHPGTHVWPHCGPTNCRLRIHLGLKVPRKTYIRVAEETRTWEEGKIFIFDDSFEHEVWHNGTEFRLVLIVDIWHPELTKTEKYNLSAI